MHTFISLFHVSCHDIYINWKGKWWISLDSEDAFTRIRFFLSLWLPLSQSAEKTAPQWENTTVAPPILHPLAFLHRSQDGGPQLVSWIMIFIGSMFLYNPDSRQKWEENIFSSFPWKYEGLKVGKLEVNIVSRFQFPVKRLKRRRRRRQAVSCGASRHLHLNCVAILGGTVHWVFHCNIGYFISHMSSEAPCCCICLALCIAGGGIALLSQCVLYYV